ncbi:hypothetical protein Q4498_14590 [Neptunomonas phycophila]|uniref:toxin VasX n=1 Tax=Neptunomonas phycophila TaxID=1572645 RepID=UPI0026E2D672|nr:toxin VasX [Neptunomonas phycophila]MDO6469339.1 hypothetical protein [Neptunomonas phycophila]
MEWDKAYNDIFATNKRIANSEAIEKAKNLKPVVNTPASPPQSVPPGFSSKGRGVKAELSIVDTGIIPIFPMRYVFTADTLEGFTEGKPIPTIPSDVNAHEGYELVRIRRGYLYVLDDQGTWQVFWYETNADDENGSTNDGRNPNQGQSIYSFTKYIWKDGHAKGEWELDLQGRRFPFAFVNKDRKSCWVGYSEERWPGDLFGIVERDEATRKIFMSQVDLSSRNGPNCFPLEQISSLTNCFKAQPVNVFDFDTYALENLLRYTSTAVESDQYLLSYGSHKMGVVAALHDPLGYHLDVARTMEVYQEIAAQYYEENEYAITMGTFIRKLQEQDEKYAYLSQKETKSDSLVSGASIDDIRVAIANESKNKYLSGPRVRRHGRLFDAFGNDPLHPKFEEEFSKFEDMLKEHDQITKHLTETLGRLTLVESDHTLMAMLKRIDQEITPKGLDKRNSEFVRFAALTIGKSYRLLTSTHSGSMFVKLIFNELFGTLVIEDDYDEQKELKKALSGLNETDIKKVREKLEHLKNLLVVLEHVSVLLATSVHGISLPVGKNFKVGIHATLSTFAHETSRRFSYQYWKKSGSIHKDKIKYSDTSTKLVRNITQGVPQEVKHLSDLQGYFEDTMRNGGTNSHKVNFVTGVSFGFEDVSGSSTSSKNLVETETVYKSKILFELDDEGMSNFRYNRYYEVAQNGFGVFLGLLSLFSIIERRNDPNRAYTDAGRFINDPRVMLIQTFADSASAVYAGQRAWASSSAHTTEVAAHRIAALFSRDSVRAWASALGPDAHEFARRIKGRLAPLEGRLHMGVSQVRADRMFKGLGVVGIAMAGFQLYDSYKSKDTAALVGNSFNLLGSIFLLSSASLFVLVGFIAVVVGAVIKTLAFDEFEKWIEQGYWGVSKEYWAAVRPTINKLASTYKEYTLASSKREVDYIYYFNEETAWFYDLISTPEIKVEDGSVIKLYCTSIYQESEIDRVISKIKYYSLSPSGTYIVTGTNTIESDKLNLVEPGVVSLHVKKGGNMRRKFVVKIIRSLDEKSKANGEFNLESDFF